LLMQVKHQSLCRTPQYMPSDRIDVNSTRSTLNLREPEAMTTVP
jgi:hypothetical protein